LGTSNERDKADPAERFDIDLSLGGISETVPDDTEEVPPLAEELPAELPAPDGETDSDGVLRELIQFHVGGRPAADSARAMPALLQSARDLANIRYDYPVCLMEQGSESAVRPLRAMIDDLLTQIAGDDEAGRRLSHHVYLVERAIKGITAATGAVQLSDAWAQAEGAVLSASGLSGDQREALERDLATARQAMDSDGELIDCTAETPGKIFRAYRSYEWGVKYKEWRDELDGLIRWAQDILGADDSHSPEAHTPDYLRSTLGAGDAEGHIDTGVMSNLISGSQLGDRIPADRRRRIESIVSTMRRFQPAFEAGAPPEKSTALVPLRLDVIDNCGDAARELEARAELITEFFKAVRIARLEVENRYHPEVHDEVFSSFDVNQLTTREVSLCPPVLVELDADALGEADMGQLFGLLESRWPLRILVQISDLAAEDDSGAPRLKWLARLGRMGIALSHPCVVQSPISRMDFLARAMDAGFAFDGPTLFAVFAGSRAYQMGLSHYLASAAAMDARIFPTILFNPAAGPEMADRIDIGENMQAEATWPSGDFRYLDGGGEERSQAVGFTPADYWLADVRFARHYWVLPRDKWHDAMVPATEYDLASELEQVPYVTAVDEYGQVVRVLVSRAVMLAAAEVAASWRYLQEIGGVDGSFANRRLNEAREQLDAKLQAESDSMRARYDEQLDQDVGKLTEEIVRRIAQQLIMGGQDAGALLQSAPAAPSEVPPAPAGDAVAAPETEAAAPPEPAAPEVEEEEDETAGLDDPYIDTPLCTSCDECTRLNPQMFVYNENKQATIKDPTAGSFRQLVEAAEKCPVHIIHPGKPKDPNEAGLDDLVQRAAKFA